MDGGGTVNVKPANFELVSQGSGRGSTVPSMASGGDVPQMKLTAPQAALPQQDVAGSGQQVPQPGQAQMGKSGPTRISGKQSPRRVSAPVGGSIASQSPASVIAPRGAATDDDLGTKVRVKGDGWGGGRGTYNATVTEADEFTFTVLIEKRNPERFEETHVLREHCTILSVSEAKRRRTV